MVLIKETFGLSAQEFKALLIMNMALTIPARIFIGILVDKYGPRITYLSLLYRWCRNRLFHYEQYHFRMAAGACCRFHHGLFNLCASR